MSICFGTSAKLVTKRVEEKLRWGSVSSRVEKTAERACWLKIDAWRSRHCAVEKMTI